MRLIDGETCRRVYSYLRLDRAPHKCDEGFGIGVLAPGWDPMSSGVGVQSGDAFLPTMIPGCQLWCETDTSRHLVGGVSQAVVFPADPCANGTFTGDVSWTKGANWTLPGTTADKSAGAANNLTQACLVVGNTYTITYTINAVADGTLTVYAGTTAGTARAAAGTYTETLACAGNTSLGFVPSAAATTCQIDNVLVSPRNVSQLTDLTGTGHHLLQATAAKQVLFDTAGKRLQYTDAARMLVYGGAAADFKFLHAADNTFFVVWNPSSLLAGDNILFDMCTYLGGLASGMYLAQSEVTGNLHYIVGIGTGVPAYDLTTANGTIANGANKVIAIRMTALGQADIWCGGGAPTTQALQAAVSAANPLLALGNDGANVSALGHGQGKVIYDSALSLANINRVGRYLARTTGAAWSTAT